jgi:apolipoprotein N-acyltransferase
LPVLRAANTGVSAVIDARGGSSRRCRWARRDTSKPACRRPLPPTLYARIGDWPAILLALLLAGGVALSERRKKAH